MTHRTLPDGRVSETVPSPRQRDYQHQPLLQQDAAKHAAECRPQSVKELHCRIGILPNELLQNAEPYLTVGLLARPSNEACRRSSDAGRARDLLPGRDRSV